MARVEAAQDSVVKVLVLGDSAVGKTSLIKRYVHNLFSEQHKATVGVDFALKAETVRNTSVRLQLWDIAGQEHFRALSRVYYKDALGALLVYDKTRHDTFEGLDQWKQEIATKVQLPNGKPLPVVLCANKSDLEGDIDEAALDEYCQKNGYAKWLATSAKDDTNIHEAGKALLEHILDHEDVFEQMKQTRDDIFRATARPKPNQESSGYCCS